MDINSCSKQLMHGYKQICYHFGVNLRPPIIRVADISYAWGTWSTQPRMITIADRLIEHYPWNTVLEILKHEMSHQMVCEIYNSNEQHGELFRQCAQKLGTSSWATQANVELNEHVYASEIDSLQKSDSPAVRKVRKLLALTKSSEEHESALAMQKAREICTKHNLKSVSKQDDEEYVVQVLNTKQKRIRSEQLSICSFLTENFPVHVILGSLYNTKQGNSSRTVELYGRIADVKIAEYVFHFLENQLNLLWDKSKNILSARSAFAAASRGSKISFCKGMLAGFSEKLNKNVRIINKEANALMLNLQTKALSFANSRCPKTQRSNYGSSRNSQHSYASGYIAGKKLKLRKGVAGSQESLLLLADGS